MRKEDLQRRLLKSRLSVVQSTEKKDEANRSEAKSRPTSRRSTHGVKTKPATRIQGTSNYRHSDKPINQNQTDTHEQFSTLVLQKRAVQNGGATSTNRPQKNKKKPATTEHFSKTRLRGAVNGTESATSNSVHSSKESPMSEQESTKNKESPSEKWNMSVKQTMDQVKGKLGFLLKASPKAALLKSSSSTVVPSAEGKQRNTVENHRDNQKLVDDNQTTTLVQEVRICSKEVTSDRRLDSTNEKNDSNSSLLENLECDVKSVSSPDLDFASVTSASPLVGSPNSHFTSEGNESEEGLLLWLDDISGDSVDFENGQKKSGVDIEKTPTLTPLQLGEETVTNSTEVDNDEDSVGLILKNLDIKSKRLPYVVLEPLQKELLNICDKESENAETIAVEKFSTNGETADTLDFSNKEAVRPSKSCSRNETLASLKSTQCSAKSMPHSEPLRNLFSSLSRMSDMNRITLETFEKKGTDKKKTDTPDILIIDGIEFFSFETEEALNEYSEKDQKKNQLEGTNFDENDAETHDSKCSSQHVIPILPTKTDDITKIKGWRNKLFLPETTQLKVPDSDDWATTPKSTRKTWTLPRRQGQKQGKLLHLSTSNVRSRDGEVEHADGAKEKSSNLDADASVKQPSDVFDFVDEVDDPNPAQQVMNGRLSKMKANSLLMSADKGSEDERLSLKGDNTPGVKHHPAVPVSGKVPRKRGRPPHQLVTKMLEIDEPKRRGRPPLQSKKFGLRYDGQPFKTHYGWFQYFDSVFLPVGSANDSLPTFKPPISTYSSPSEVTEKPISEDSAKFAASALYGGNYNFIQKKSASASSSPEMRDLRRTGDVTSKVIEPQENAMPKTTEESDASVKKAAEAVVVSSPAASTLLVKDHHDTDEGKTPPTLADKVTESVTKSTENIEANVQRSAEYSGSQSSVCTKEFCNLGCVCASLKVRKRKRGHCGKTECMFTCTCNSEVPETSSNSSATSNNTDNSTFMTDNGPVKRRRATRLPARFSDSVFLFNKGKELLMDTDLADEWEPRAKKQSGQAPKVPPIRITNLHGKSHPVIVPSPPKQPAVDKLTSNQRFPMQNSHPQLVLPIGPSRANGSVKVNPKRGGYAARAFICISTTPAGVKCLKFIGVTAMETSSEQRDALIKQQQGSTNHVVAPSSQSDTPASTTSEHASLAGVERKPSVDENVPSVLKFNADRSAVICTSTTSQVFCPEVLDSEHIDVRVPVCGYLISKAHLKEAAVTAYTSQTVVSLCVQVVPGKFIPFSVDTSVEDIRKPPMFNAYCIKGKPAYVFIGPFNMALRRRHSQHQLDRANLKGASRLYVKGFGSMSLPKESGAMTRRRWNMVSEDIEELVSDMLDTIHEADNQKRLLPEQYPTRLTICGNKIKRLVQPVPAVLINDTSSSSTGKPVTVKRDASPCSAHCKPCNIVLTRIEDDSSVDRKYKKLVREMSRTSSVDYLGPHVAPVQEASRVRWMASLDVVRPRMLPPELAQIAWRNSNEGHRKPKALKEKSRRQEFLKAMKHLAIILDPTAAVAKYRTDKLPTKISLLMKSQVCIRDLETHCKNLEGVKRVLINRRLHLFTCFARLLKALPDSAQHDAVVKLTRMLQDCCKARDHRSQLPTTWEPYLDENIQQFVKDSPQANSSNTAVKDDDISSDTSSSSSSESEDKSELGTSSTSSSNTSEERPQQKFVSKTSVSVTRYVAEIAPRASRQVYRPRSRRKLSVGLGRWEIPGQDLTPDRNTKKKRDCNARDYGVRKHPGRPTASSLYHRHGKTIDHSTGVNDLLHDHADYTAKTMPLSYWDKLSSSITSSSSSSSSSRRSSMSSSSTEHGTITDPNVNECSIDIGLRETNSLAKDCFERVADAPDKSCASIAVHTSEGVEDCSAPPMSPSPTAAVDNAISSCGPLRSGEFDFMDFGGNCFGDTACVEEVCTNYEPDDESAAVLPRSSEVGEPSEDTVLSIDSSHMSYYTTGHSSQPSLYTNTDSNSESNLQPVETTQSPEIISIDSSESLARTFDSPQSIVLIDSSQQSTPVRASVAISTELEANVISLSDSSRSSQNVEACTAESEEIPKIIAYTSITEDEFWANS